MKNSQLVLSALLLLSVAANAEQITLKNGDKITGSVVKSDGKTLVFKTDYAGDLSIKWDAVQELTSDKKLFIAKPDKSVVSGTVTTQDTDLVVTTPQGGVHVPKTSAVVIRSEGEQAAFDAALHPSLGRNWAGGLNLGFALARGNSETKNVNLALNAARATNNDKITLYANSLYSTNDKLTGNDRTTANEILGGARYDHDLTPRVFAFGAGDFQHDELQFLDIRSILTGGLGFHAIKDERTTLDFLAGANYTRENYAAHRIVSDATTIPITTQAVNAQSNSFAGLSLGDEFSHKAGKSSLFTERFFYYPNLNNGGGYRTALDLGLTTKFNNWLGWQLGFSDRYTSKVVLGNKNNDVLFTTGLALTFKH